MGNEHNFSFNNSNRLIALLMVFVKVIVERDRMGIVERFFRQLERESVIA